MYFPAGKKTALTGQEGAEGLFEKKDIIKYVMTKTNPAWEPPSVGPFVNKPQWGKDSGDVVFMDDDHFQDYVDETEQFLAFFYLSHGCDDCKATKPHYSKASTKVSTPMLAFDCSGDARDLCEKGKIETFPTIKYFTDDDY